VLYDTRETGNVFRLKIKDESTTKGTINDALLMMHEGDSAIFKVNAERFFTETKGEEVPSFIKPGDKLKFYVKLHRVFDMKKYLEEKRKSSNANESEEMEQLKTYLSISNITVSPTSSGMYYVETKKGTGKKPDKNSTVKIDYMVSFVNGEIFDNTYQRNEPFEFQLGKNLVIPGLEEGVKYMNEGGEATLIIPSKLAYGSQQYKAVPPFSTLVFEIKLINVNK
jgi:FKBP-type peptidyl-prolyl cis-trans isomerase